MIKIKEIKSMSKSEGKRISKEAIKYLGKEITILVRNIIKKAARKAEFKGRRTIKKQDITF